MACSRVMPRLMCCWMDAAVWLDVLWLYVWGLGDVFRLRVVRRSFSLWTPSCDSTDGWLGSPEPEPVTMFPIEFNCCFS